MNLIVRFALVTMSATAIACQQSPSSEPVSFGECVNRSDSSFSGTGILGGEVVQQSNPLANRVVLIKMVDKGNQFAICTGTPISADVILTAAHCLDNKKTLQVAFQTNAFCDTGFRFSTSSTAVTATVIHPGYNKNIIGKNDMALLKLAKPSPSTYQITPIMTGEEDITAEVSLTGYGRVSESFAGSYELRTVKKTMDKDLFINGDNTIQMDQTDSRGICSGDSGGPMFFHTTDGGVILGGVNSAVRGGSKETLCRGRGVGMLAYGFRGWLQKEMRNLKK